MGRKKTSPDLSVHAQVKKSNLFTDDQIDEIAIQFGFNNEHPLTSQLEDASYRFLTGQEETSVTMIKRSLTNTADEARNFKDSLDKSGKAFKYTPSFLPPSINMTRFEEELVMIEAAYRAGSQSLEGKRTKPGTKTDHAYRGYIRELHEIYKTGTGCDDKSSRNDYTGEYTGQFLEFLALCLKRIGREKNKSTVARDITEALRES